MNGAEVIALLRSRGETVATAESVTGGELAAALTAPAGASHAFKGGVIAYSIESKVRELGVAASLIDERSVYSSEVAAAMAAGARQRFATNWSIATTGVAGPGSSHGNPPGLVWVAIAGATLNENLVLELNGERDEIRRGAVASALSTFTRILSQRS